MIYFIQIITSTHESKNKLEKAKHKYFDFCKLAVEQEKLVLKLYQDKEKNQATEDEIKIAHGMIRVT